MRAAPHVRFISDSLRHNAQRCARAPRPMPCPAYMWRTAPLRPLHGPAPLRILRIALFFRMMCAVRVAGASRLLRGGMALRAAHMVRPNTHGAASACPPTSVSVSFSEQVVAPRAGRDALAMCVPCGVHHGGRGHGGGNRFPSGDEHGWRCAIRNCCGWRCAALSCGWRPFQYWCQTAPLLLYCI